MANGLRRLSALLTAIVVGTTSVRAYGFPDCVKGPLANNTVCDTAKDAITRAKALIDIWTDEELTNNTVNASPGVPRLGIPEYNWWSEALVCSRCSRIVLRLLTSFLARCRWSSRCQLCILRRIQLCHFLSPAYSHGGSVRRPPYTGYSHRRQHRGPCFQQRWSCRIGLLDAEY